MAALTKQQALDRKRKERLAETVASPAQGLLPGDRYYDQEIKRWVNKPGATNTDDVGGIADYIDEVMATSGMTGVQAAPSGNAETGSAGSGEGAVNPDEDPERAVQEALDNGIGLEEIAAGALGAAAGAIATRLLTARKGEKKSTVAEPATDTAGDADEGGPRVGVSPEEAAITGTDVATRPYSYDDEYEEDRPLTAEQDAARRGYAPYEDITAIYEDLGLPPPSQALPAPEAEVLPPLNTLRAAKGTQPPPAVRNPELPQSMLPAPSSPIDAMISEIDGPNQPLADPELEEALQVYAQQMREQGNFDPSMDPSKNPNMPMMDPYIAQRLKAILASM